MQLPIIVIALAFAECAAVVALALRQRSLPGRTALLGMQIAIAWWLFSVGMELLADEAAHKVVWSELAWPGIVATVLFWCQFLHSYIRGERGGSTSSMALVAVISIIAGAITLTNDWHAMFYSSVEPLGNGGDLRYHHGPFYYAFAAMIYAAMLLSAGKLLAAIRSAPRAHRHHFLALLACAALPWIADFSYTVLGFHLFNFDPTPFSFAVVSSVATWLILRRQLFSAAPLARDALVDLISDALIVVDEAGTIIEANSAAGAILGSRDELCGKPVAAVPVLAHFVGSLNQSDDSKTRSEIRLNERLFDIKSTPVTAGFLSRGNMLLLRDVTEQRRLERQLIEQAIRDPLTGLYNRRYAHQNEARLLHEADTTGLPISAIMIDLDHFKKLNDEHGHSAGDAVLCAFAEMLLTRLRPSDCAMRFGGEEFLILLPGTREDDAIRLAEDLRRHWRKTLQASGLESTRSTFSAGVADYPYATATADSLLQAADAALYRAKRQGRNRVVGSWQADDQQPLARRRVA